MLNIEKLERAPEKTCTEKCLPIGTLQTKLPKTFLHLWYWKATKFLKRDTQTSAQLVFFWHSVHFLNRKEIKQSYKMRISTLPPQKKFHNFPSDDQKCVKFRFHASHTETKKHCFNFYCPYVASRFMWIKLAYCKTVNNGLEFWPAPL
jgi:hypothetical protein